MIKSRHAVLALVVAATFALALSACGNSDSSAPGNETDTAFVGEMIPHHESAIEMAKIAQERARHGGVENLAANIISAQEDEITEMRTIQGKLSENSSGDSMDGMDGMDISGGSQEAHGMASDAATLRMAPDEMGMSMDVSSLKTADPFDQAFLQMMLPHHEGAVVMAKAELDNGENPDLRDLAKRIISGQTKEISEMQSWLAKWYPAAASATSGSTAG